MKILHRYVCAFSCALSLLSATAAGKDYADYVNPFIGTTGDGNTFPGAAIPFGMVKVGPDCADLQSNSGYRPTGGVKGFSHTHVSGTGGGCKYGNILIAPFFGSRPQPGRQLSRDIETVSPGYFSMILEDGAVEAEMTVTPHAAVHRYTFQSGDSVGILVDAGSILGEHYGFGEAQNLIGSEVRILSDHEIEGYCRADGGWNMGRAYTVYFYASFSRPMSSAGVWKEDELSVGATEAFDDGSHTGAWFAFDKVDKPVEVRVGISYLSEGKAKANCMAEVAGRTFDEVHAAARSAWNDELGKVSISTDNKDELVKFYTALYHSFLQPVDKTGENALWKGSAPYYDDFYCIWDTFRTLHPLFTVIAPEREAAIVNSLIDIYRHEGYMPDGRSGDSNGRTQGGSNADMVVAEAVLKGLPGIDGPAALEAMMKDAEADPGNDARVHGRGGVSDYKKLGYVSTDYERGGTRTLEYAANDYAIAQCAAMLGRDELAERYFARARNWENLWKDIEFEGASGFIMPRKPDGNWHEDYREPTWDYYSSTPPCRLDIEPFNKVPENYLSTGAFTPGVGGNWVNMFYESNSWEYSFYVPHDVARLMERCGGRERFVDRLDRFFNDGHYNITNEPGFLTPCLYIYAGEHAAAVDRIHTILANHYTTGPDGLPGNDDSGSMSSWYAFHKMGFFPVAGQDVYLITAPQFEKVDIALGKGRQLCIEAPGVSDTRRYIASATLNGKPLDRAWFTHGEIADGGVLRFEMTDRPTGWGSGILPPSQSDVK